jgi:hypothetical protein
MLWLLLHKPSDSHEISITYMAYKQGLLTNFKHQSYQQGNITVKPSGTELHSDHYTWWNPSLATTGTLLEEVTGSPMIRIQKRYQMRFLKYFGRNDLYSQNPVFYK